MRLQAPLAAGTGCAVQQRSCQGKVQITSNRPFMKRVEVKNQNLKKYKYVLPSNLVC